MGLFSLLIQIMSSLAIYFNLVSSLVEVNWFASTPSRKKKKIMKYHFGFFDSEFLQLICSVFLGNKNGAKKVLLY